MKRGFTTVLVAIAIVALQCGCAPITKTIRTANYTKYSKIEGADDSPNCLFGMPRKTPGFGHGPTQTIKRAGYTLEHSAVDKVPVWVCEHVERNHITGGAQRGNFKPDPEIPAGQRAELADYRGSGFDRGHQAPAGDFKFDQDRMDETFFLSNMVPQVGPLFNQAIWRVLEDRVRKCVSDRDGAFVTTGAMFWDPAEDNESTADGIVEYSVIGDNEVAVPTHLYKIVVTKNNGQWEAIAFVMANKDHPRMRDKDYDFRPFVKSIDWIELHTGLNFMPKLDSEDPGLATRLESTDSAIWPCLDRQP